jgi:nitrous oxidase accessory protein NosD
MKFNLSSNRPRKHLRVVALKLFLGAALITAVTTPALASCVNPGGRFGCFSTIGAAVAAARPGSAIIVAPGTYKETVVIGKPLSLIGSNSSNTIIDATGLPNGVFIDGFHNPGLSNVVVSGFTLENANFEGALIVNASDVILRANHVHDNNKSLLVDSGTCPGIPDFEPGEQMDCGEGIHIMGVSYSSIANNISESNSGGILISDDSGQTHDNIIINNQVHDNPFACGIVLASHQPAIGSTDPHHGIVNNLIIGNQSVHNGIGFPGAGAGVGIFSNGTGVGLVSGNTILNNRLLNNGLPGVTFHSHVGPNFHLPPDDLNNNIVIGNYISGNGTDIGDTATPGPTGINLNSGMGGTPITGTVIRGNKIENETADVVINTPADVDLHFNNLLGGEIGVDNTGSGEINATNNYWGCFNGPGAKGCSTVSGSGVVFVPFLRVPFL